MALTPLLLLLFLVFVVVFFLCAVAVRAGVSGSVAVVDFRVAALAFCCVLSLFMVLFLLLCCLFFLSGLSRGDLCAKDWLSHAAIFAPRTGAAELTTAKAEAAVQPVHHRILATAKAEAAVQPVHNRIQCPGRWLGQ